MARVVLTVKIFPTEAGADLKALGEKIKAALPEGVSVYRFSEEPIAFTLVALIADIIMPEEGGTEAVEKALTSVEGVKNIQVLMVRKA